MCYCSSGGGGWGDPDGGGEDGSLLNNDRWKVPALENTDFHRHYHGGYERSVGGLEGSWEQENCGRSNASVELTNPEARDEQLQLEGHGSFGNDFDFNWF